MAAPEEVRSFLDEKAQEARQHNVEYEQILEAQRQREKEIIDSTQSFCPVPQTFGKVATPENIERALVEGSDDPNILRSLLCMNNSVIVLPKGGKSIRIRRYFQNLRQIGAESVDAYATTTDVDVPGELGSKLFVIKTAKNLRNDLLHEYFVGAYGTNKLRAQIPNFSYLFGIFSCSPPFIDNVSQFSSDRIALTYCQNDLDVNQVNYILYENIKNSRSLKDFIVNGCTFEQYLNVLIQIVFAIDLAARECGFNHNDLHDENVLIVQLNHEITIRLQMPDGTFKYLRTSIVAMIIDYGRSHITYNGEHFGYSAVAFGVYPDRSYPLADIFKLFLFTLEASAFGNRPATNPRHLSDDQISRVNPGVFDSAKALLDYFDPNLEHESRNGFPVIRSATGYITDIRPSFFALPDLPQFVNTAPADFYVNGIARLYPDLVNRLVSDRPISQSEVYGCSAKGTCRTVEQALMQYTTDESQFLSDPYVFFDMLEQLPETESMTTAQVIGSSREGLLHAGRPFFSRYLEILLQDKDIVQGEYQRILGSISLVKLQSGAMGSLRFDNEFLDHYKDFIDWSVKAVDLVTTMAEIHQVLLTILQAYPDLASQVDSNLGYSYNELPERMFGIDPGQRAQLDEIIRSIHDDVRYVQSLNPQQVVQLNPKAVWLFQKMPSLISAIAQI
jgi:hypothetical protein